MKIGVIGTGNMGSILIEAMITSEAVSPEDMIITNRTLAKAFSLQKNHPGLVVKRDAADVVQEADVIFICLKPLDIYPLLEEIRDQLRETQIIISITSPISVEQLEAHLSAKVVRMIPSITNRALSGPTLWTFGKRITDEDRRALLDFSTLFSQPVEISEPITRIASDITSCGPAFITYLLERLIEAAVEETDIDRKTAVQLATKMMIGYGKLLEKNLYTLDELRKKVHVKGGVTGEGLKVLEEEARELFHHVIQKTHAKFYEDQREVDRHFAKD